MSKSQVIEDEIVEMLSTIVEEKDAYPVRDAFEKLVLCIARISVNLL